MQRCRPTITCRVFTSRVRSPAEQSHWFTRPPVSLSLPSQPPVRSVFSRLHRVSHTFLWRRPRKQQTSRLSRLLPSSPKPRTSVTSPLLSRFLLLSIPVNVVITHLQTRGRQWGGNKLSTKRGIFCHFITPNWMYSGSSAFSTRTSSSDFSSSSSSLSSDSLSGSSLRSGLVSEYSSSLMSQLP